MIWNALTANCGRRLREYEEVVRYDKRTGRQISLEGSRRVDADDLFDPEVLQRLEIGPMVNEVRKDMMTSVFAVPGYECDGIRREDEGLAKFSCQFPFLPDYRRYLCLAEELCRI